jgi:hypothetical protein
VRRGHVLLRGQPHPRAAVLLGALEAGPHERLAGARAARLGRDDEHPHDGLTRTGLLGPLAAPRRHGDGPDDPSRLAGALDGDQDGGGRRPEATSRSAGS